MKWIGQHIYDLASRFRDDVYLEDLTTTTETSVLVVDSDGKVSKSTTLADDIIEAEIDTLAGLTSFGAAGATTSIVAGDITMYNAVNDGNPTISLGSSATNRLEIKSTYNSGNQNLCDIDFTTYTASTQSNDGRFNFYVDEVLLSTINDTGLFSYGNGVFIDDGCNIAIQNTTASSATEGGKLRLMADDGAAMGDDHRLGVIEFHGAEDASGTDTIGARIEAMCDAAWSASENGARLDFYTTDGNASESKVLTLDSDKLATFTGAVTVTGALTGTLATVSQPNITTLAGVTALGAAGNPLTVTSDQVIFASAAASDPLVNIQNTANDASAPRLRFTKNRGGDAVDADNVGEISFWSYDDGTPSTQQYAFIKAQVHDATSDQESGSLQLGVASHDGDIHVGLSLVGGDEDGNINVNLGLGANSAINIPGNIDLAGDIDVDGTLETDALTIGGAAVLAQATASAVGAVELATTGEADTGTDTARAVTPAGSKSHVDANARKCILRHHAFYINDNPMVQNSLYFGGSLGHQPSNWNDPQAAGGVIGDTESFTIAKGDENWGMVLPFDISKVEVQCSLQPQLGTGDDFTVAIYTGIRPNDSASALTLTLAAHQSIVFSSGSNRTMINDVSLTADLAKNTMIYVGVGSEDNTDAKNGRGYLTVTVTER